MTWTLHFDGLCAPRNPGGVIAYGYRIVADQVYEDGRAFPERAENTNNVAEYYALGFGLKRVLDLIKAGTVCDGLEVFGDSQLVVNQVTGKWDCSKDHLIKLRNRCRDHFAEISRLLQRRVMLNWIPREQNEAADQLSKAAYTKLTGKPVYEHWSRRKTLSH